MRPKPSALPLPLLCLILAGALPAQTPPPRTFDVASVKVAVPPDLQKTPVAGHGDPRFGARYFPGRAEFHYVDLQTLICTAYKIKRDQLSGPASLSGLRYDIVAKYPSGATRADVPAMLQELQKIASSW
jgi:uncharacterized protein (TIGR03435 family)